MLVQLNLSPEQLLVITKLSHFTRLGTETQFGNAATELAIMLEQNLGDVIDMFETMYGTPEITTEFSEEEGMVINVV